MKKIKKNNDNEKIKSFEKKKNFIFDLYIYFFCKNKIIIKFSNNTLSKIEKISISSNCIILFIPYYRFKSSEAIKRLHWSIIPFHIKNLIALRK